jgi:hypothetical protein
MKPYIPVPRASHLTEPLQSCRRGDPRETARGRVGVRASHMRVRCGAAPPGRRRGGPALRARLHACRSPDGTRIAIADRIAVRERPTRDGVGDRDPTRPVGLPTLCDCRAYVCILGPARAVAMAWRSWPVRAATGRTAPTRVTRRDARRVPRAETECESPAPLLRVARDTRHDTLAYTVYVSRRDPDRMHMHFVLFFDC